MKVIIEFEDNEATYSVDFLKLCKVLKITEAQVKQAVQKQIAKS